MTTQWINFGILNTGFLLLFAFAEYLYQKKKWAVEHTRKLVHITAGLMALSFPFAFNSWVPVALTTGGFAGILWLTKRNSWLQAINGIERKSHGSYLYPLTLMICFLGANYMQHPIYYLLPMLLMAVGDPVACLVGKKYPLRSFNIPGGTKSIGGMLGCFLTSTALAFGLLTILPLPLQFTPIVAAIILGATATIAEALSGYGTDNISIPLSLMAVLYWMELPLIIA